MFPETGKKHALYRTTLWHRNTRRWIKREAGRNTPTGLKSEKTRTAPNHTVAQKHKKMDKERSWEHAERPETGTTTTPLAPKHKNLWHQR
jgi:hypothetical protein